MSHAIVLENVSKSFGTKLAVSSMALSIPRGGLYGFIGPNGAGKTTTIRLVMSILLPDDGRVSVLGGSALAGKDRIGYVPEERGLYRKMRVGAFLGYMARLKEVAEEHVKPRVRAWLERVGLTDVERKRCEELSKGMQQKVQFIAAVIHEPELLILDEPFSGLDPVNMRLLRELVLEQHARGATVLFSTHVMPQAEQICEDIIMIHDGVIVLNESMASVRSRFDPRTIELEPFATPQEADLDVLATIPGIARVSRDEETLSIHLADRADVTQVMGAIAATITPRRLELARPTLEDVFFELVEAER